MLPESISKQQSEVRQLLEGLGAIFGTGFVLRIEDIDTEKAALVAEAIRRIDPSIIANSMPAEGRPNQANLTAIIRPR